MTTATISDELLFEALPDETRAAILRLHTSGYFGHGHNIQKSSTEQIPYFRGFEYSSPASGDQQTKRSRSRTRRNSAPKGS